MSRRYHAHTLPGEGPERWEPLGRHLQLTAEGNGGRLGGAAEFASAFGGGELGRLLGLWHDAGKYSAAFQERLAALGDPHAMEVAGRVDHSTYAAVHARGFGLCGRLMSYALAGHHGGLPDDGPDFDRRLAKELDPVDPPPGLMGLPVPAAPPADVTADMPPGAARRAFRLALFTRMLFSCLVDADFLATESFMSPDRAVDRPGGAATLADLRDRLDRHLAGFTRPDPSPVDARRAEVLAACRAKADLPPGLFTLDVPTGGGKTLSSMAFALSHAARHGLRRVVYAAPFTSIIEQTADVFRAALGDAAILEVHSNLALDDARLTARTRLAAENFDAPVVVTTNVQLFESLMAAGTARCRKLHRLARSVIVLDEAQALPPELLRPTLWLLEELTAVYGCTVVLCTATQPAVERREGFPIGLAGVTPIVDDAPALHAALRRVRVEVAGEVDDEDLADRLGGERQALCVVNTRGHAADLAARLPGALHLSANLCAAHRAEVVAEMRRRLDADEPCVTVSTTVIEAGVDVDFPAVYRAAAGLDSVAQAAGRCNRHGRLPDLGRVVVFEPGGDRRVPPHVRGPLAAAREVIPDHADDLLGPAAVEAYFRLHYWRRGGQDGAGWDAPRIDGQIAPIADCFALGHGGLHLRFREAARRYRLIDDAQVPVLVPWGAGADLRAELEKMDEDVDPKRLRGWDRRAQRFVVTVFEHTLAKLLGNGPLAEKHGRYYLLGENAYDDRLGLRADVVGLDAELLASA